MWIDVSYLRNIEFHLLPLIIYTFHFFVSLFCSNLNGKYSEGEYPDYGESAVFWDDWLGYEISLKSVTIMIRPKSK